jgi:putative acetyltransferase
MSVQLALERPDQPEVIALIEALDAYQQALYPPESNHLLDIARLTQPDTLFCVARVAGTPIGCGAAVLHGEWGEIKRMFVLPEGRGRGLGRQILAFLEAELASRSINWARLETGIRQSEALALYTRMGYREIGPFGAYAPDPLSVFMEKRLLTTEMDEVQT